jgi:ABC-type cobalamin/Fe3+-siderophores transport system ATPase subunit
MKIDIHVHTKKVKSGDPEARNIDGSKFNDIIRLTDVKILAITNHNHFDLSQYKAFRELVNDTCQIWPGVELDVVEDNRRAHLIVIANPVKVDLFEKQLTSLLKGIHADSFTSTIEDIVKCFDRLDVIYITHYSSKKPDMSDESVAKLISRVSNKQRVLKEASNSISAGIYVSHGHKSIFGSDIRNWHDYFEIAKTLPDLRLPVESYEQFCLLLEKDGPTIQTILDKKSKENISISPFGIAELISIDIYNDINILFGSKGTGKTEILRAISRYYNDLGHKTDVYESNMTRLDDVFDLKGSNLHINIGDYAIDNCIDEFKLLKNATEKNITSLSSYLKHFAASETNKIAKTLRIKDFTKIDDATPKRKFLDAKKLIEDVSGFQQSISTNNKFVDAIGEGLSNELQTVLNKVIERLRAEVDLRAVGAKTIVLFNHLIKVFISEISKKTGQPEKPIQTGFADYARNRISIERSIKKIVTNMSKKIPPKMEFVGDLGEKGQLYCQTNLTIQEGNISNSNYSPFQNVSKTPQKEIARILTTIPNHVYSNTLFEKLSELNSIDGTETINGIIDLLLFQRHFSLNDEAYRPSNGESSMILLYNELQKDKEIFLIDEPEKSLGNDYINDVIVPLLKEKAKLGKIVIVATHDANIAVRTLPYNSIYRKHDANQFYTYVGNPFSNNMNCLSGRKPSLDWKLISMKTLEGGKEAFGERGKIYGNG